MADKIDKLRMSINLHLRLYDKGTPLISDAAYDAMVREYNDLTGVDAGGRSPLQLLALRLLAQTAKSGIRRGCCR